MSAQQTILNRLVAQGITEDIYYEQSEGGASRPYIVILQDNTEPHNTHNGPSTIDRVQCRVLSFGDRLITSGGIKGAKNLADEVRTALDYYRVDGTVYAYFQNEQTESVEDKGNKRAFMVEQTYDVWLNR
jgi:hypothetical protein